PTISGGGGEAGSTIRLYDETQGYLGSTTADANGNWVWTAPEALAEGTYSIYVTSEDLAGNLSEPSNSRSFTIDTAKPAVIPVITEVYDDALPLVGNVPKGGATNDATPTLSGTAAPNSSVVIRDGETILGTVSADSNGDWSFTPLEALSDGSHSFTAVILSASGVAGDASLAWEINIVTAIASPVITGITPDNGPDSLPGHGSDRITNDNLPLINGTGAAGATVSIFDGLVKLGETAVLDDGTWAFQVLDALSDGTHQLTASQVGIAGNQSLPSAITDLVIDTVAPSASASPESIVNTVTAGNQFYPSIAKLPSGGYVVGWHDVTLGSGMQIYDATGNRVGEQINYKSAGTTYINRGSVITTLTSGNIVQVYWGEGNNYADVFYRIYSPTGELIKPTAVLTAVNTGVDIWTTVTPLSGGGFVAAWSSATSSEPYQIYIRVFNASGTALGTTDTVVSQAEASVTGDATAGKIAALSGGGFVVTWAVAASAPSGGSGVDVYAQRYSVNGSTVTAQGNITRVNVTTAGDQENAEAVGLLGSNSGSYVIAWQGPDADGAGLYFRRFGANGAALDDTDQAINLTTAGNQYFPQLGNFAAVTDSGGTAITALSNGGFVVVWSSQYQDGSGLGAYMRIFDAAGKGGAEIQINTTTEENQYSPVITELNDGRLAVAWVSVGQDGSGDGIIQTLFNADGSKIIPIANVHLGDKQLLGEAVLQFALGASAPEFRLNGNLVTFSAIKDVYGIDIQWNAATAQLTLTGSASSTAYESVLHLLTASTAQPNISISVTDLAGNQAALLGGIDVSVPGQSISVAAPTQSLTITEVIASDGAHPGTVAPNGTTDDLSLRLKGTLSAALLPGQAVLVYDNNTLIDTATVTGSTWTSKYMVFAEGPHSYTAQVVNLVGGEGAMSGAYGVNIVLDVPAIDVVIDNHAPVLGAVSDGGVTSDARPVIEGSGTESSTVNVYDNGSLVGSAKVDASGHWSLLVPVNLVEGAHSFSALYLFTVSGTMSEPSPAYTVTVDRTPPAAPVIDGISDANSVPVVFGSTVSSTLVTLTGTAEAGAIIIIQDGATVLNRALVVMADATGHWRYTTSTLLDGEHNFSVTAVDAAGHVSAPSNGIALGINSSPIDAPILYAIIDSVGPVQGSFINGGETDDTTPTLYGTGAFPSGIVRIFNGAAMLGEVAADAQGNWRYTPTLTNHQNVQLSAANVVNGVVGAHSGVWTLTVNTDAPAAPTITSVFDNVLEVFGDIANGGITNDSRPVLWGQSAVFNGTVNIYDTVGGLTTLLGQAATDGAGNWAFNVTSTLADGLHSLSVKAVSLAGVEGAASTARAFTVDTVAPDAPTFTLAPDTGLFDDDGITNAAVQTLSGAAGSAESKATLSIYDDFGLLGTTTANADGSWTFSTLALSDGVHNLYATAMDTAGNVSGRSEVHGITIDTVAPDISIGNITVNSYLPNSQTHPQSAKLAGGGYVTVWTSAYQDGSGLGVYMQRFDASGRILGGETLVNTHIESDQSAPSVVGLKGGTYVVTWQSALQDGGGLGVYLQRFAADGSKLGNETLVNTYTANDQSAPQVAALEGGGYVVGWNSIGQAEAGSSAYFQMYDVNGIKEGGETRINSTTNGSEKFTSISALSGGGFVATYFTQLLPALGYYKMYNADGTVSKTDTKLAAPDNSGMLFYAATALAGGGFATVQDSPSGGLDLQIYNAAGTLQGSVIPLSSAPSNMTQLSNGDIALAWASSNVIYVQLAQANGSLIGSPLTISHDTAHDNAAPVVTALPNGNFVVSWQSNAGGTYDIVQHLFAVSGTAANPIVTPINQVVELQISDANALAHAELSFGAAYAAGANPAFRDSTGHVYTVSDFNAADTTVNHGITAQWNTSTGTLSLLGAASAADYQGIIHMLVTGGTASATASLTVEDLAGNSSSATGITVDPVGFAVAASIALSSSALSLDFGIDLDIDLDKVTSIEQADLGGGDNTLNVTLQDVLNIPDSTPPQLLSSGDASDSASLKIADGFVQTAGDTPPVNGVSFDAWPGDSGATLATLLLEQDITVQPIV
ncbi:MAG: Ig-like domain-containing protein, partial [Pseudomonadales bacterium]|nr:Ig-like domain-containing protein [Pseudomonadales bacterium]